MFIINNIYIGHIPGADILDAIDHMTESLTSTFPYATLLCVDSDRNIVEIVEWYGISELFLTNSNQLFQCRSSEFENIFVKYKFYTGFASVLYSRNIITEVIPKELDITSDMPFSEDEISKNKHGHRILQDIAKQITRLGQVLALGDGLGLNYATDIKMIAEQIEKMKLS